MTWVRRPTGRGGRTAPSAAPRQGSSTTLEVFASQGTWVTVDGDAEVPPGSATHAAVVVGFEAGAFDASGVTRIDGVFFDEAAIFGDVSISKDSNLDIGALSRSDALRQ